MDREFRNWINIIKCSKPFVPHANQLRGGYDSGEHPPSHTGHSFPPPFSPQSRTHTLSLSLFIFSHSSCICSPPCKNRHIPPEQKFRQRNAFFFHLQFEGPHTPLNLKFPLFFSRDHYRNCHQPIIHINFPIPTSAFLLYCPPLTTTFFPPFASPHC